MNTFMHTFCLIFSLKYIPTGGFQYIDGKLIIYFQKSYRKVSQTEYPRRGPVGIQWGWWKKKKRKTEALNQESSQRTFARPADETNGNTTRHTEAYKDNQDGGRGVGELGEKEKQRLFSSWCGFCLFWFIGFVSLAFVWFLVSFALFSSKGAVQQGWRDWGERKVNRIGVHDLKLPKIQ